MIAQDAAFICNETMMVTHPIHEMWFAWLRGTRIPEVMASGCFARFRLVRLVEVDESEGVTYAIQWEAASKADCNRYVEMVLPRLSAEMQALWGENCVGFRTIMAVL